MATNNEYGFFWNSENGDRKYNAESFELWLKHFFTSGVFANELKVTAGGGMSVNVSAGYCNVDGKVQIFDDSTLTLQPANSSSDRVDSIVIERNDSERKISLKAVTGTNVGIVPNERIWDNGVYQLVIATVLVSGGSTSVTDSNITDRRADSNWCGIVKGTVEEINLNEILSQFTSQFEEWFDGMKGQLTTDAAGNLQTEIDELKNVTIATVDVSGWQEGDGYWYTLVPVEGMTADDVPIVSLSISHTMTEAAIKEAQKNFSLITDVESGSNVLSVYSKKEPSSSFDIMIKGV